MLSSFVELSIQDIFQPSLLIGNREESRFGEDIGKVVNQLLAPLIPKKYKGIEGEKVAQYMLQIAQKEDLGVHFHVSQNMH